MNDLTFGPSYNGDTYGELIFLDYTAISSEDLVIACLQSGSEPAWAEFVRRFHPLVGSVVLRLARQWGEASPQLIDDLIQETYLKLCAERLHLLESFKSRHKGAIYAYIKVFTANLVHDHFKNAHSQKRGGGTSLTSIDRPDTVQTLPAAISSPAILERDILIRQIDACLQGVISGPESERDRRIFWLYYRVGLAASAIAALPTIALSTKGVESTLLRLTRQIRQRLTGLGPQRQDHSRKGIPSTESL